MDRGFLVALESLEKHRAGTPQGAEQRRSARVAVRGEGLLLALQPSRAPAPVEIELRDVSWSGFGFLAQQAIAVGSRWLLHFAESDLHVACQPVIVQHGHEVTPGTRLYGVMVQVDAGLLRLLGVHPRQLDPT